MNFELKSLFIFLSLILFTCGVGEQAVAADRKVFDAKLSDLSPARTEEPRKETDPECKDDLDCDVMYTTIYREISPPNVVNACIYGFCFYQDCGDYGHDLKCTKPACKVKTSGGCFSCAAPGTPGTPGDPSNPDCPDVTYCYWGSWYRGLKDKNKCYQWVRCNKAGSKTPESYGPYEVDCDKPHDKDDPNLPDGVPYPRFP